MLFVFVFVRDPWCLFFVYYSQKCYFRILTGYGCGGRWWVGRPTRKSP